MADHPYPRPSCGGTGRSDVSALVVLALAVGVCLPVSAADVRAHTRTSDGGQQVSAAQAQDLTLTLTSVARRPIQTWVRVAGSFSANSGRVLVRLSDAEAPSVVVGQRARVFSAEARSLMHQGRVERVGRDGRGAFAELMAPVEPQANEARFVVEIVTDRGLLLSVPNEALIEEGAARHIVYLKAPTGEFIAREVKAGVQGELYTEVVEGLAEGDQVLTTGSFFVDSEMKLKGTSP